MTNNEALREMKKCMELRGLTPSTQKNYIMHIKHFTRFFGIPLKDMDYEHVREFLYDAIKNKKLSGDYTNSIYSSIKFLYETVFGRDWNMKLVPRKKKIHRLQEVLTIEETKKLILSLENIKHRAMLLTIYGSGLRLNEVSNLKVTDIDSKNMQIFIRQGKGNKDRYSILSQSSLELLREYYKEYRPKEKITICIIVQSLAQLDAIYGQEYRKIVADNCAYKAVLSATDVDTQKYFSSLVGTQLVEQESFTKDRKNAGIFTGPQTVSSTVSLVEKAIIKPETFAKLTMMNSMVALTPVGTWILEKQRYDQVQGCEALA